MKTELSLYVDGSRIICEQYGDINNAKKILLFCYGFPGSNRLVRLCGNLKNELIATVEMNYRGDKKCEGEFSFLDSMNDIKAVAYYLKEHYKVPLHALGYSMGGFYVTNIVNQEPHIFEKVMLLNPVVDSMALFSNKSSMDKLWKHAKNILALKTPEDYKEEIKMITSKHNPMGFVKKIKSNITIIQSTADEVLEPGLAKRFYTLLDCEKNFLEVPDAKHDLMGDEKELINKANLI